MNLVELPQLVKGMHEAVVIQWLKGQGEPISAGEPLWEVETEKAIVELESPFTGILRAIHCQPGEPIPVGFCAAQIGEANEPVLDLNKEVPSAANAAAVCSVSTLSTEQVEQAEQTTKDDASSAVSERVEEIIIPFPLIQEQQDFSALRATGTDNIPGSSKISCSSRATANPSVVLHPIINPYTRSGSTATDFFRSTPQEGFIDFASSAKSGRENVQTSDIGLSSGNVSGSSCEASVRGKASSDRSVLESGSRFQQPVTLASVADLSAKPDILSSVPFHSEYENAEYENTESTNTVLPDSAVVEPLNVFGQSSSAFSGKWAELEAQTIAQEEKRIPLSPLRRTITRRMAFSCQNIPTSVLFRKADVTDLVKTRLKINRFSQCKITLNDYITKAIIMALVQTPGINTAFVDNEIIQYSDVNLGFAVDATDGLLVPVLHKAQNMDVVELAQKSKKLIQSANEGTLTLKDFAHPTFSVSNTGVFGVEYTVPIIVAPQSGIMGVGAVVDEPVLKDGIWEAHKKLGLSYAFDHRIIDGALGAKFLQNVINLLENPLELIWKQRNDEQSE